VSSTSDRALYLKLRIEQMITTASAVELQGLLAKWNDTTTAYPRNTPIHELFEQCSARCPNEIALIFENEQLTYSRLNERANKIAHRLRRRGVRRGTLVGLCMVRSFDLIAGMLGILKAGGAYVPLDYDYPDERLAFMLDDTAVPVVVAHEFTEHRLAPLLKNPEILSLDSDAVAIDSESAANPSSDATSTDLAYVMYTSGSTGQPKGIMIGHRAVVRLVRDTNYCDFGADQVFLQLAPISFDASTFEIWGALLNGARLAIMPPEFPGLNELAEAIERHRVTTLWLTSGLFNLMVDQRVDGLRPLRQLLAGGDVLSPMHVRRALDEIRDGTVINGYGPTESTTFACCFRMAKGYQPRDTIPIGRPVSNTTAYVLNENLEPVPAGASGELCLGGDGLAHGYWNNEDLTQQKFIRDPFSSDPTARLYRTGDKARFLPDGNLEFQGRVDNQVKIHGHRIEPEEIEIALRQHSGVGQAVVIGAPDARGERRLVAYVVGVNSGSLHSAELKGFLASRLPHFMVPSTIIQLEHLPLNANGKVDRSALPGPDEKRAVDDRAMSPATSLEAEIRRAWEGVLSCAVGPDDNFFDLGGDSLQLIEVHSELEKTLKCELSIMDLFEFTTIRALATHLAEIVKTEPEFAETQDRASKQRAALARQKKLTVRP
jgi:aspartate racemase